MKNYTKIATAGLIAAGAVLVGSAAHAAPAAPAAPVAPAAPAAPVAPAAPAPASAYSVATITGPGTAQQGKEFRIDGKADRGLAGSKVTAYQNGKKFNATRTVSSSGDISMRIVSGIKGLNKFQFKITDGAGNVWETNTITVNVK